MTSDIAKGVAAPESSSKRLNACVCILCGRDATGNGFNHFPGFIHKATRYWNNGSPVHVTLTRIVWGMMMKTFVLVSFGFLALAFYELSGGADFDPSEIREQRLAVLAAEEAERAAKKAKQRAPEPAPVVVAEAPKVFVDTDPPLKPLDTDVTRVALNLTTFDAVSTASDAIEEAVAEAQQEAVPQNVSVITSSADTPAIIPSLINPNDGVTAPLSQIGLVEDIRTVSGNRVNVRQGPGTDFGVVGSIVRGDAVIILEDNGDGWVRFESVDGATNGWVADFLLTES